MPLQSSFPDPKRPVLEVIQFLFQILFPFGMAHLISGRKPLPLVVKDVWNLCDLPECVHVSTAIKGRKLGLLHILDRLYDRLDVLLTPVDPRTSIIMGVSHYLAKYSTGVA